jgi:hypothetical protein
MDYYVDHGDLLVNSVGWNIPLLNETVPMFETQIKME